VNLLKSPLRRAAAATAGAIIGVAGALAFAAPASAHHPEVEPKGPCVNEDGTWQLKWRVTNSEDDLDAVVTAIKATPEVGTLSRLQVGEKLPMIKKDGDSEKGARYVEQTGIPADVTSVHLDVTAKWVRNGYPIEETRGADQVKPTKLCKPKPPVDEEPPPAEEEPPAPEQPQVPQQPGEAKPILEFDCDTLVIGLDNPKDGVEITLNLKTSKGETRTLTVKPGEKKTEKFSASSGFKITVSLKGYEDEAETIEYEQPENCEAGGGGGELAVTGANASTVAGGAGVLLALGGLAFFLARRRKVKFTA
jgi:LPXTG-motif cell wall-anchored protein